MKLYVEEQDMPSNCAECKAEGHYENSYGDEYGFFCPFGYKAYTSGTRDTKRLDNCPLVPIPPHGRLINADLIMEKLKESCRTAFGDDGDIPECSGLSIVADYIESAPTVIPASEEGENTDFLGEEYAEAKGLTEDGE